MRDRPHGRGPWIRICRRFEAVGVVLRPHENERRYKLLKTQEGFGSPKWTILELFLENLGQACHITAVSKDARSKSLRVARRSRRYYPSVNALCPLSANIEARGLCQFPLAVVKRPKSLYIEFESAGDVKAVERADAEFGSIPSAEIDTYL